MECEGDQADHQKEAADCRDLAALDGNPEVSSQAPTIDVEQAEPAKEVYVCR